MNGLLIVLGLVCVGGLIGFGLFRELGVICIDPPKPPEPEARTMSLDQGLREIREEKERG